MLFFISYLEKVLFNLSRSNICTNDVINLWIRFTLLVNSRLLLVNSGLPFIPRDIRYQGPANCKPFGFHELLNLQDPQNTKLLSFGNALKPDSRDRKPNFASFYTILNLSRVLEPQNSVLGFQHSLPKPASFVSFS